MNTLRWHQPIFSLCPFVAQVNVRQQSRVRDIHETVKTGRLYMIDLAGSERAKRTKVSSAAELPAPSGPNAPRSAPQPNSSG